MCVGVTCECESTCHRTGTRDTWTVITGRPRPTTGGQTYAVSSIEGVVRVTCEGQDTRSGGPLPPSLTPPGETTEGRHGVM